MAASIRHYRYTLVSIVLLFDFLTMGCQQSSPEATIGTRPSATKQTTSSGPSSNNNKHSSSDGVPSRLHPLLTDDQRQETVDTFQKQFSVDHDFVVHLTHVKSKMHQKLLKARQHLEDDHNSHVSAHNQDHKHAARNGSPRISFARYDPHHPSKPSREQQIAAGIQLIQQRLEHLHLRQDVMRDDGNCQFRSLARQLYGNQDKYHEATRRRVVEYLRQQSALFEFYFASPEEWQQYLRQMQLSGTWGDELTLKAASNCFRVKIHVLTSSQENYYLCYAPDDDDNGSGGKPPVDIFLAYISPIHYNSIEVVTKR